MSVSRPVAWPLHNSCGIGSRIADGIKHLVFQILPIDICWVICPQVRV